MGATTARLFQRAPQDHPTFLRTQAKWSSFVDLSSRSLTIETIKAYVHSQARSADKQAQKEDVDVDSFVSIISRLSKPRVRNLLTSLMSISLWNF